jgi:hypothetical protein
MSEHNQLSNPIKLKSLSPYVFPVFVIALTVAARLIPGPRIIDDAYITYRYAQNILSGAGFLYNPGEAVQGTTTPLYTLLLALIGSISGGESANFPQIALWVNTAADALTCLLILKISRHLDLKYGGPAAALVWAVAPYSVTFAIGGLETSLYIVLLTASAAFTCQKKYPWAALTASLSILTRPDAVLLVGLLIIERLRNYLSAIQKQDFNQKHQKLIRDILLFTIPLGIWSAFAFISFGGLIPHSVQAKQNAYFLPDQAALIRFLQHYGSPFLEHLSLTTSFLWIGLFLYPFLYVIGARRGMQKAPEIWAWILYPWLYLIVFSIANPLIFRWYLTPPLLPYVFFILAGLENFLDLIFKNKHQKIARLLITILVFGLPILSNLQGWEISPNHGPSRPAPEMAYIQLELLYQEAADLVLLDISETQAVSDHNKPILAAGDVGVLGYDSGLPILDTVGLNSSQSLKYYPVPENRHIINYAVPSALILDEQPAYLVILEVYGRETLLKNPDFLADYQLLKTIPTDIYTSQGMLIFKRIQ